MILAGDVGGTNTRLGLFRWSAGRPVPVREKVYPSAALRSLADGVKRFLTEPDGARLRACAVGVAGPVVAGRTDKVNLAWSVDERRLARAAGLPRAHVLNDLEALGWGIPLLPRHSLANLAPGTRSRPGNAAVIAAGTGLGTAILFWDGARHLPSAGEGGHQDFAPRNRLEADLLAYLRRRHGRVSWERTVSGPGLWAIYRFLVERTGTPRNRPRLSLGNPDDPAAAVAEAALAGTDRTARRALDLFASLYGSAAGNLALVARATAGVYLGGGIAPKILPALRAGRFVESFRAKGRLSSFLARIPIRVILEPRAALLGAARYAALHADGAFRAAPRAGKRGTR